jgi:hypothetical protein
MTVDPYLVHAYWEVTDADLQQVKSNIGPLFTGARPILRIYDITCVDFDGTNAHRFFDIEIDLRTRNWYIHLWTPEKTYCADLGFTAQGVRFFPVVRSNTFHVPRSEPSPRFEVTLWGPIREKGEQAGAEPGRREVEATTRQESGSIFHARPAPVPPVAAEVIESDAEVRRVAGWNAPSPSAASTGHAPFYACDIGFVPEQPAYSGEATSSEMAGEAAPDTAPERRDLTMECERRFVPGLSSR